jgi:hypothetical protein
MAKFSKDATGGADAAAFYGDLLLKKALKSK